jgi:hypothetical protein
MNKGDASNDLTVAIAKHSHLLTVFIYFGRVFDVYMQHRLIYSRKCCANLQTRKEYLFPGFVPACRLRILLLSSQDIAT